MDINANQKINQKIKLRVAQAGMVVYLVITLPLLALFLCNPHCRNTFLNIASHYRSKLDSVRSVHIGDSITAGGGHWSLRLYGLPFDAINLAGNGYTVAQIRNQVSVALTYKPEMISVLGGTNDVLDPRFDLDYTMQQYDKLLSEIETTGVKCIVTLTPYQTNQSKLKMITAINKKLIDLATLYGCATINLNPEIAPDGVLLPQYTSDGTHLSEAAYDIWADRIADLMTSP